MICRYGARGGSLAGLDFALYEIIMLGLVATPTGPTHLPHPPLCLVFIAEPLLFILRHVNQLHGGRGEGGGGRVREGGRGRGREGEGGREREGERREAE